MNCEEFKYRVIEDTGAEAIPPECRQHMEACPACRDFRSDMLRINDMINAAGPQAAPPILREKILAGIEPPQKIPFMKKYRKNLLRVAAVAVAGLVAAAFVTVKITSFSEARAASQVITNAKESIRQVSSIYIEMDVRSYPSGNIGQIALPATSMSYRLNIENKDTVKWVLQKGEKYACKVEGQVATFYRGTGNRKAYITGDAEQLAGWFVNLLEPDRLFENLSACDPALKTEKEYPESNEIEITVEATAGPKNPFGNFEGIDGRRLINKFIFSKDTYLLKKATVLVVDDPDNNSNYGSEIIVETTDIKYNIPVDLGVLGE